MAPRCHRHPYVELDQHLVNRMSQELCATLHAILHFDLTNRGYRNRSGCYVNPCDIRPPRVQGSDAVVQGFVAAFSVFGAAVSVFGVAASGFAVDVRDFEVEARGFADTGVPECEERGPPNVGQIASSPDCPIQGAARRTRGAGGEDYGSRVEFSVHNATESHAFFAIPRESPVEVPATPGTALSECFSLRPSQ
jgi:hypothetical protein